MGSCVSHPSGSAAAAAGTAERQEDPQCPSAEERGLLEDPCDRGGDDDFIEWPMEYIVAKAARIAREADGREEEAMREDEGDGSDAVVATAKNETTTTTADFPTVDISPWIDAAWSSQEDKDKVVEEVLEQAVRYGSFHVTGHGVPRCTVDRLRLESADFFRLPKRQKARYAAGGGGIGGIGGRATGYACTTTSGGGDESAPPVARGPASSSSFRDSKRRRRAKGKGAAASAEAEEQQQQQPAGAEQAAAAATTQQQRLDTGTACSSAASAASAATATTTTETFTSLFPADGVIASVANCTAPDAYQSAIDEYVYRMEKVNVVMHQIFAEALAKSKKRRSKSITKYHICGGGGGTSSSSSSSETKTKSRGVVQMQYTMRNGCCDGSTATTGPAMSAPCSLAIGYQSSSTVEVARDGRWAKVPTPPPGGRLVDELLHVKVGHLMHIWSNGLFRPCVYRERHGGGGCYNGNSNGCCCNRVDGAADAAAAEAEGEIGCGGVAYGDGGDCRGGGGREEDFSVTYFAVSCGQAAGFEPVCAEGEKPKFGYVVGRKYALDAASCCAATAAARQF